MTLRISGGKRDVATALESQVGLEIAVAEDGWS